MTLQNPVNHAMKHNCMDAINHNRKLYTFVICHEFTQFSSRGVGCDLMLVLVFIARCVLHAVMHLPRDLAFNDLDTLPEGALSGLESLQTL